jgi:hypothetical protein
MHVVAALLLLQSQCCSPSMLRYVHLQGPVLAAVLLLPVLLMMMGSAAHHLC